MLGSTISPSTNMPPPPLSPLKQWENDFGATPCEDSCEMTDIACCPKPKIPSTALSDLVKSPFCKVLHLFSQTFHEKRENDKSQILKDFTTSLPKQNRSRRILNQGIPKNRVEMQQIWHIVARGSAAISVLECVTTLIALSRAQWIRGLNPETTSLIWTRD